MTIRNNHGGPGPPRSHAGRALQNITAGAKEISRRGPPDPAPTRDASPVPWDRCAPPVAPPHRVRRRVAITMPMRIRWSPARDSRHAASSVCMSFRPRPRALLEQHAAAWPHSRADVGPRARGLAASLHITRASSLRSPQARRARAAATPQATAHFTRDTRRACTPGAPRPAPARHGAVVGRPARVFRSPGPREP